MLNNVIALLNGGGAGGGGSSFESIATSTPTSGSAITFSSIPSTYQYLQIRLQARFSGTDDRINLTFNSDTGSNYTYHWLVGDGAAASASGGATQTSALGVSYATGTASIAAPSIIDIHDYANTTKNKTIRSFNGWDTNGSGRIRLMSGLWMNTSAVNSVTLTLNSGTFATGTSIALYGIKG